MSSRHSHVTECGDIGGILYAMRLSGGLGYSQNVEIDWTVDLAGVMVRFAVELKGPHDVLPRISYRTEDFKGRAVSIMRGTEQVQFPLGAQIPLAARYGAGSETAPARLSFRWLRGRALCRTRRRVLECARPGDARCLRAGEGIFSHRPSDASGNRRAGRYLARRL